MITCWNDAEEARLERLPWGAQILYLRGLRRFMDYKTGIVGITRGISYQSFREVLYVEPVPGRNTKNTDLTMQFLRTAVSQLEKAGLVVSKSTDRRLIFYLPLADTDQSAQKKDNRGKTEEQQSKDNRVDALQSLESEHNEQQIPPSVELASGQHTSEDRIPDKEKTSPNGDAKKKAPAIGRSLPEDWTLPDECRDWAMKEKGWTIARTLEVADRFKNYWLAASGPNARKKNWNAAWKFWCSNEKSYERNNNARRASGRAYDPIAEAERDF